MELWEAWERHLTRVVTGSSATQPPCAEGEVEPAGVRSSRSETRLTQGGLSPLREPLAKDDLKSLRGYLDNLSSELEFVRGLLDKATQARGDGADEDEEETFDDDVESVELLGPREGDDRLTEGEASNVSETGEVNPEIGLKFPFSWLFED